MMEKQTEKNTSIEKLRLNAETVRCIIKSGDKVLILQKSSKSMVSGKYEFPGGNIENEGEKSTYDEQVEAVRREVREETQIDIDQIIPIKVDEFDYEFRGKKDTIRRKVHLFVVDMGDTLPEVATGTHEDDYHKKAIWVTEDELNRMLADGKLLGNSQHFEKVFEK